jgi:Domain of unknown function (DUF4337)
MNGLDDPAFGKPASGSDASLNTTAAVIVVLAATFSAVCYVKDGNIVRAMSQAQAVSIDTWTDYQMKGAKQYVTEASVDQLAALRDANPNPSPELRAAFDRRISEQAARAKQLDSDKAEIKKRAEGYQRDYDGLKYRDEQLDSAQFCLTVCLALLGVTSLTQKRWLLVVGVFFAVIGVMLGLGGFLGYKFHLAMLARVLG